MQKIILILFKHKGTKSGSPAKKVAWHIASRHQPTHNPHMYPRAAKIRVLVCTLAVDLELEISVHPIPSE